MTLYDELVARGLIAQVTDEAEIRELINNGKATFYIGFDPTADSLHVGHFLSLIHIYRSFLSSPLAAPSGHVHNFHTWSYPGIRLRCV